ncbi:hypothetical protein GGE45_006420 [Rhizobium aethiopicum]|nr:hypothetical protein [Rhizobium aethiopicum]MBB4584037.1 hypothetical protein [Rhizobium aethiopicum]
MTIRRGTQWVAVVIEGVIDVVMIAGREVTHCVQQTSCSAAFLRALCRDNTDP